MNKRTALLTRFLAVIAMAGVAAAPAATATAQDAAVSPQPAMPLQTTVTLTPLKPTVSQDFVLDVTVQWPGPPDAYGVSPPVVPLPRGMQLVNTTAEEHSAATTSSVIFHMTLRSGIPGRFVLDPLELHYTRQDTMSVTARAISGVTVEVMPIAIFGMQPILFALLVFVPVVSIFVVLHLRDAARRRRTWHLEQTNGTNGTHKP